MNNSTYTHNKKLGNQGEEKIAEWLSKKGFTILAQNYTIRQGELDIVAQKDEVVAFVEVKTRRTEYFPLAQVVTPSKQRKIGRAAQHFALSQNLTNHVLRFDIATLIKLPSGSFEIEYIENAFVPNL